jgi:hypothetical protein
VIFGGPGFEQRRVERETRVSRDGTTSGDSTVEFGYRLSG